MVATHANHDLVAADDWARNILPRLRV